MEGAYAKVLDARARAASASDAYTNHFLDQLSATVRCVAVLGWAGMCWLVAGAQRSLLGG